MYFTLCPKCNKFMIPYIITTGKTFWKCHFCGYDSINEAMQTTYSTTTKVETFPSSYSTVTDFSVQQKNKGDHDEKK